MILYKPTRRDFLVLVIVLAIAAFLRFMLNDSVVFLYDEASMALQARDMALGNSRPLLGLPTSTGLPNSPISIYLMAIPYLFSDSHTTAVLFVMLINVIAVGQLWAITFRYLGRKPALITGLLYAASPWAVLFGRKIWTPDLLAPLCLLATTLILLGFYEGRSRAQFLAIPMWLIAVQIHYAAGVLIVPLVWLAWKYRNKLNRVAIFAGLILGVEVLIPFALGVLQSPPQEVPQTVAAPPAGLISLQGVQLGIEIISGLGVVEHEVLASAGTILASVPRPDTLWLLLLPLFVIGVATLVSQSHPLSGPIVGWAILPVLIFTPSLVAAAPHYYVASGPALLILVGMGGSTLWDVFKDRYVLKWATVGVFGAIIITQGAWMYGYIDFGEDYAVPGDRGASLGRLTALRDSSGLTEYEDVLILTSREPGDADVERYWVWRALLNESNSCIRPLVVSQGQIAVFPEHPFAVVAPDEEDVLNAGLYLNDAVTHSLRKGEPGLLIATHETAPDWPGPPITTVVPQVIAQGVTFTGFANDIDTLHLRFLLNGPSNEQPYVRVVALDARGTSNAMIETPLWMGAYGCEEDTIILSLPLGFPDDTDHLQLIMGGDLEQPNTEVELPVNSTGM